MSTLDIEPQGSQQEAMDALTTGVVMFSITSLVKVQCDFDKPEEITALFHYLHENRVPGKWSSYNVTHFEGTFPPEDAERVIEFLKTIGLQQRP